MDKNTFWGNELSEKIGQAEACFHELQTQPLSTEISKVMLEKLESFIKKTEEAQFQIAFVGTIKAGKSTLINALLQGQYASTNVAPETAVLTKFGDSKCNYFSLEVEYYSYTEWRHIWDQIMGAASSKDESIRDRVRPFIEEYNKLGAQKVKEQCLGRPKERKLFKSVDELASAIAEYTSAASRIHYYVKEVYVGIKDHVLPEKIVLCDTPGLDDVLEYRSNVTKRYIDSASAVVVCVESSFLGGEQLHTIQSVFSRNRFHPERVYVVGTKIDKLTDPQTDWKIQKETWVQYLQGKACFGSRALANDNIVGVSAWIEQILYNIDQVDSKSRDYFSLCAFASSYSLDTDTIRTPETYTLLRRSAAVTTLMNILKEIIFAAYRQSMIEDLLEEYDLLQAEVSLQMKTIIGEKEMLIGSLSADKEKLEKKLENTQEKIENIEERWEEFEELYDELCHNKKVTSENIKHKIDNLIQ